MHEICDIGASVHKTLLVTADMVLTMLIMRRPLTASSGALQAMARTTSNPKCKTDWVCDNRLGTIRTVHRFENQDAYITFPMKSDIYDLEI
jgi:hypothetical protein